MGGPWALAGANAPPRPPLARPWRCSSRVGSLVVANGSRREPNALLATAGGLRSASIGQFQGASVSVVDLLGWSRLVRTAVRFHRGLVFVCLGLPPAMLLLLRFSTAPSSGAQRLSRWLGAPPVPSPLVGSGVPPSPPRLGCSLRSHRPTVRAALAHRCQPTAGVFFGWRIGAIRAAFAIAWGLLRLLLRCWGRVLCILLARACSFSSAPLSNCCRHQLPGRTRPQHLFRSLTAPASSWLSPLVRCRRFGSNAHALPAYVVLGSPAQTVYTVGSSLPTTARPTSHVTLPATDDGRGHAGYARRRDSLRLPPPP